MNNKDLVNISKYFSYLLRHKPEEIGLKLDPEGWAKVQELIAKTTKYNLTNEIIDIVVETNDKQRFKLSEDKNKIKANQGHSIDVDLNLDPLEPPETLLHGTAERFVESIFLKGLQKQKRHHVHLSESTAVAKAVGCRYGKLVLLKIESKKMHEDGFPFYKTANNVWLVENVPVEYLTKISTKEITEIL